MRVLFAAVNFLALALLYSKQTDVRYRTTMSE